MVKAIFITAIKKVISTTKISIQICELDVIRPEVSAPQDSGPPLKRLQQIRTISASIFRIPGNASYKKGFRKDLLKKMGMFQELAFDKIASKTYRMQRIGPRSHSVHFSHQFSQIRISWKFFSKVLLWNMLCCYASFTSRLLCDSQFSRKLSDSTLDRI